MSAGTFPKLPPLPHKNSFDCCLRTVACTMCFCIPCKGQGFQSMEGLCCKLCEMDENMPCSSCSSTNSSIPKIIKNCFTPVNEEIVQH